MKLVRFGIHGKEQPGLLIDDQRYNVSHLIGDYNRDFFADETSLEKLRKFEPDPPLIVPSGVRWGPPVAKPGKIVCVGLNYRKHAEESGLEPPEEPVLFFKATSAITGPFDPIVLPKGSTKTDWEVELALVVGKEAAYVSPEDALSHISGYVLHNDVSERAFQIERGGQWVKGKSCDSFAPLGPFVATRDEIKDPHNLHLWLDVNGERMQDGNTSDFIFDIPHVVSYISQFMRLEPGDIISTGTPEGVGLGLNPPRYLQEGDKVELAVEGLGISRQNVQEYASNKK